MRLLLTLALFAVYSVGRLIPVPGIDLSILATNSERVSLTALGFRPFVFAFAVTELFSFLPICRRLRRGGIAGRQKLNRIAIGLGVGCALVQGLGIAIAVQHQYGFVQNPGLLFTLSCVATLSAGAILAVLIAQTVSRWGIGNGFCLIVLLDSLLRAGVAAFNNRSSEILGNPLEPLVWVAAIGLLVKTFARRPQASFSGHREGIIGVSLPTFPQGIVPVSEGYGLLSFVYTMSSVFLGREGSLRSPLALLSTTIVMVGLSVIAFHLFSSRKRLLSNLPSGALPAEGDVWSSRWLVQSTVLIVGFGAAFLGGSWFLNFRFTGILGFPTLVMLVALGFDLIAEWQFRNRHGSKVERALELDNVYGACYLQGLLTKEGISSFVRSFHFRSLSFFFGPIVKMELMVPTVEFERTQEIIRIARLEIV